MAHQFAKNNKRGLINYIKATFITLYKFKPIVIHFEGKQEILFSFTIANANQFGNNAYISPFSNIQDGNIEIVRILPLSFWNAAIVGIKLFLKKIKHSKKVKIDTITQYQVEYSVQQPMHMDGEAIFTSESKLDITIKPAALLVIA